MLKGIFHCSLRYLVGSSLFSSIFLLLTRIAYPSRRSWRCLSLLAFWIPTCLMVLWKFTAGGSSGSKAAVLSGFLPLPPAAPALEPALLSLLWLSLVLRFFPPSLP